MKECQSGRRTIGIIGFGGVASLDISGPAEVFSRVQLDHKGGPRRAGYEILTIAASNRPFATDSGLILTPTATFANSPDLDTIVIPGGESLKRADAHQAMSAFLVERAPTTRRIIAFGSGIFPLAVNGLLAGRRVTCHWQDARDLVRQSLGVRLEENRLFVNDGKFYTSAGAAAAIDLTLSLIEEDYGSAISLSVARDLVIYLKRSGNHEQYSEPLQFQTESICRLSDLTTWIITHLSEDLSVDRLAARACLCPRQFGRRFKSEVGATPAEFVERARLNEARRRLCTTDATIESIAASVGFHSSDVFRRRFEQRLGMPPTEFRRRFNKATSLRLHDRQRGSRNQLAAA